MSYDRLCKHYRQYTVSRNVVSRVGHKAGRNMEVDWPEPTMRLVDPATGEVRKVYLFVACLPFSRYSYVEPTLDMKQDTWLLCHVHAFSFPHGATPCIVPDNLRTRLLRGDRDLDRVTVAELATRGFVGHGENVVLQGLTGTGKIYLARALAKATCARRVRSCHIRQPDLDDLWRGSRERPSGERELVRKYGAFGLLVVDEWPPDKPDTEFSPC